MNEETLADKAKKIKTIADIGLLYCQNDYDKERYLELRTIAEGMLADAFQLSVSEIKNTYGECIDYPTPKVDVRALVLNEAKEILMVQERSDRQWSLPGGWADIGKTAAEVAKKEVLEETGLIVDCKVLAAVFDKRMHAHPPQPFYVYKMIFYCKIIPGSNLSLAHAFDIVEAGWFAIDRLPPLSTHRILAAQLELVYHNIINGNFLTVFD